MDQPSDTASIREELARFGREPQGVKHLTVYKPPRSTSQRVDAREFSVPFETFSPEMIAELTEMTPAQRIRFPTLYEQAMQCMQKETGKAALIEDDLDISHGYTGMELGRLTSMLHEEIGYYTNRHERSKGATKDAGRRSKTPRAGVVAVDETSEENPELEQQYYFQKFQLEPLIQNQQDLTSYWALYNKLRDLQRTGIFDRKDAPPLRAKQLCTPGNLTVIDMSDCGEQQVANIIIADLLARVYRYKIRLTEKQNAYAKIIITIEEAHGFVSRERQEQMTQTLDQLRRIARRGRKRWLTLHFVTQSPQHLPSELFELANNKIIHQMTGTENLRVLKAAAGSINEGIWEDVPSLGRGRAVIVSSQYPHPIIAQIRPAASKRNYQY